MKLREINQWMCGWMDDRGSALAYVAKLSSETRQRDDNGFARQNCLEYEN